MTDNFQRVAVLSELRPGRAQCVAFDDGEEVLLVRIEDAVYAVQPTCTHRETWLDMGTVLPGSHEIECPLHIGRFDLRTGAPTNPPVTEPIKTYSVQIREGGVFVARGGDG